MTYYFYRNNVTLTPLLTAEQRVETTKLILEKPLRGTETQPDYALSLWVDNQPEQKQVLLRQMITDQGLNDDQTKRTWLQIDRLSSELGKNFFMEVLPQILILQQRPATVQAIFASEKTVTQQFSSVSDRYTLGVALLEIFLDAPSVETKNKTANWIKQMNAASVLNKLPTLKQPTEEDLEILRTHFPRSKELKKIGK